MLAVAQRLRRRDEFTVAVRTGRRAARGVLVAHLARPRLEPAAGDAPARAGFVVPRSVGGAVVRNRVRRRLRHLVRERLDALPPGALLVVRALPGAGAASHAQLGADLDGALAAVGRPRSEKAAS